MPARTSPARRRAATTAARRSGVLTMLILAVALVATVAGPASAGQTETFGAEPYPLFEDGAARRFFEIEVSPGATWTDRVRVWNRSSEPVELRLYGAEAKDDDGTYTIATYESRAQGTGSWIDVEPASVTLGPGEERIVSVHLTAPNHLPEGDRLGAVVVEGSAGQGAGGVDVVTRLGILLLMEPGTGGVLGLHPMVLVALGLLALLALTHLVRRLRRSRLTV